jgi:hypothetical protein
MSEDGDYPVVLYLDETKKFFWVTGRHWDDRTSRAGAVKRNMKSERAMLPYPLAKCKTSAEAQRIKKVVETALLKCDLTELPPTLDKK